MLLDDNGHVPGKTVTKLKPSQAMRIGAALRPQCTGGYFADGGSCALGAMWEGYGRTGEPIIRLRNELGLDLRIINSIVQLNDNAGWTREQIATWLESKGL